MRITAYTYRADTYCPTCLIETMIARGEASPAARDMPTEEVLDQVAEANGIDRYNEHTFDTDAFPKVIFGVEDDGLECGMCGEEIQ